MNIIDRDKARLLGLDKYFTGKKCARDHLSERYVSNGACIFCLRPGQIMSNSAAKIEYDNLMLSAANLFAEKKQAILDELENLKSEYTSLFNDMGIKISLAKSKLDKLKRQFETEKLTSKNKLAKASMDADKAMREAQSEFDASKEAARTFYELTHGAEIAEKAAELDKQKADIEAREKALKELVPVIMPNDGGIYLTQALSLIHESCQERCPQLKYEDIVRPNRKRYATKKKVGQDIFMFPGMERWAMDLTRQLTELQNPEVEYKPKINGGLTDEKWLSPEAFADKLLRDIK